MSQENCNKRVCISQFALMQISDNKILSTKFNPYMFTPISWSLLRWINAHQQTESIKLIIEKIHEMESHVLDGNINIDMIVHITKSVNLNRRARPYYFQFSRDYHRMAIEKYKSNI
ncbi:MAG: hypothetical protein KAS12_01405 [Candidatus Aenigmarchaeota archaeon]|nr:hypothetical protein [Candidatus Aenigmarchaeota archaeon]